MEGLLTCGSSFDGASLPDWLAVGGNCIPAAVHRMKEFTDEQKLRLEEKDLHACRHQWNKRDMAHRQFLLYKDAAPFRLLI